MLLVLFGMVGLSALIWYMSAGARERKQIADEIEAVPALQPGNATEGTLVRVTGAVTVLDGPSGGDLRAPFSDKRCVWFRSETSRSLDEDVRRFVLERPRETRLVIDATHARVAIAPLSSSEYWSNRAIEYSLEHRDSDGAGPFMKETIITPGLRVTIAGILVRERVETSAERGYRDDAETQLVLTGTADHPLSIAIADPL